MPGHASCKTLILLGIFFLLLHACMSSKKAEIDGGAPSNSKKTEIDDGAPSRSKKTGIDGGAPSLSKKTEIDGALSHSNQYLSAGDYQKAIDMLRTAHAKYPEDKPLLRSYQKAVEEMKGSADRAFDREEFVSAGKSYRLLLRNYQHFRDFAQQLSFDKKNLNARVTHCSEYLFKRGVGEYRSGNIKQAISTWEALLSFDPGNAEAGKACNVATSQLKNLQQKK